MLKSEAAFTAAKIIISSSMIKSMKDFTFENEVTNKFKVLLFVFLKKLIFSLEKQNLH